MATVTASSYVSEPKTTGGLVGAITFRVNSGAVPFGSAGDTILLGKIPDKSDILDLMFQADIGGASAGSAVTLQVIVTPGDPASATSTIEVLRSLSMSSGTVLINGFASAYSFERVSLSDASPVPYASLKAVIAASSTTPTASFSMAGVILYKCDY